VSTSGEPADSATVWADAALASELFAVDPQGLGGIHLRAGAGPDRDRICTWVRELSADGAPFLRVPLHVTEDRLLGGLSLAATLREGRLVNERGLLAQADGGVLVLAMAERLEPSVTSNVCAALDHGELSLERDGVSARVACRVGVLALDEGLEDEKLADSLRDRLAFTLDLTTDLAGRSAKLAAMTDGEPLDRASVGRAREHLAQVELGDPIVEALCQAAVALGVASVRAAVLAVTAARAHAALQGRTEVTEVDAAVAARLVLGPRATRLPEPVAAEPEPTEPEPAPPEEGEGSPPPADPSEQEAPPDGPDAPPDETSSDEPRTGGALEEVVLEAARSGIPGGLLDALVTGRVPRGKAPRSGTSGAMQESMQGGRPSGTRPGIPRGGEKLNLVETLRAAAPWQRLRRRQGDPVKAASANVVEVRKEDFRVTRFQKRTETTVIFAVDASGSAALQRLAEAKGAVEQVLADCYARRDHVALVAFRGTTATLLLPPTRSLARVRRRLADLAGGGTTPLAAGIDAALALALEARKQDKLPLVVLMTDGRANVARSGSANERSAAAGDALASARAVRAAGVRALLLDTAPRPRPEARLLATEMDARYLPLPYLDAAGISRQVRSLASEAR
jgi:magnesium chelatase subunit D